MSTVPKQAEVNGELRRMNGRVMFVGRLPDDFLRIPGSGNTTRENVSQNSSQERMDHELACVLQKEFNHERRVRAYSEQYSAQLFMTVVDAKLTKNYGILSMSTYVRFRIGHTILETQTTSRTGKEPKWNQHIRW